MKERSKAPSKGDISINSSFPSKAPTPAGRPPRVSRRGQARKSLSSKVLSALGAQEWGGKEDSSCQPCIACPSDGSSLLSPLFPKCSSSSQEMRAKLQAASSPAQHRDFKECCALPTASSLASEGKLSRLPGSQEQWAVHTPGPPIAFFPLLLLLALSEAAMSQEG